MKTIRAEFVLGLPALLDGWHLIDVGVGPRLDVAVLCSDRRPRWRFRLGQQDERGRLAQPGPNRIRILAPAVTATRVVDLEHDTEQWLSVQPLGADRWLLVREEKDPEAANVRIVSLHGRPVLSFAAGYGIYEVQTTPDGRIWMLYQYESLEGADEAVQEYALHGATCFSEEGTALFHYHDLITADAGWDAYPAPPLYWGHGFNVADDATAWLYTCDALVRLDNYQIAATWPEDWRADEQHVTCPDGFAVHGDRALFARVRRPGIERDGHGVYLVNTSLQGERLRVLSADGEELEFDRAIGRRHHLFLIRDQDIHRIDLSTL